MPVSELHCLEIIIAVCPVNYLSVKIGMSTRQVPDSTSTPWPTEKYEYII